MKYIISICMVLLMLNCSTARLVDTWKNPDIDSYTPTKVLVVGLTPDKNARRKFEKQLKNDLELRGIQAMTGIRYFDNTPTTEEDLKALEHKLLNEGFDTILFTKVIGIEDKIVYQNNFDSYEETFTGFSEDYLKYQNIYNKPDYYNEYVIYHAETSMYCICPGKERELIWKGYVDIVDPKNMRTAVDDYVKLVILILEEEQLIASVLDDSSNQLNN